jgi:hypothetical protein
MSSPSALTTTAASDVVASLDAGSSALHAKLVAKDPQIIKQMKKYMAEGKTFYSFEYFPPKVRRDNDERGAQLASSHHRD